MGALLGGGGAPPMIKGSGMPLQGPQGVAINPQQWSVPGYVPKSPPGQLARQPGGQPGRMPPPAQLGGQPGQLGGQPGQLGRMPPPAQPGRLPQMLPENPISNNMIDIMKNVQDLSGKLPIEIQKTIRPQMIELTKGLHVSMSKSKPGQLAGQPIQQLGGQPVQQLGGQPGQLGGQPGRMPPPVQLAGQPVQQLGGQPGQLGGQPGRMPSPVQQLGGSDEYFSMFEDVGDKYGVNPQLLDRMAKIESGYNPKAKAKSSSAKGMFQFLKNTWKEYAPKLLQEGYSASRFDPESSAAAAALMARNAKNYLQKSLKRDVEDYELYIAHNLGAGGAARLLKADPSARIKDVLPQRVIENNPLFFRNNPTVGESLDRYQQHIGL